jgi:hypothetical protein
MQMTEPTGPDTVPSFLAEAPERPRWWPWAVAAALGAAALATGGWAVLQARQHAAELASRDAAAQRERATHEATLRTQARQRAQGQGALALQESGLHAAAAAALARLGPEGLALDGGIYGQAARFLAPRLVSFDEAVKTIQPGEAVRWQDSNLVRGLDGALREVPGQPIVAHLFAPGGSELLVVDAERQAWVYQWPSLATGGPHALGAVCIDNLDFLHDGRFAVDTAALRGAEAAGGLSAARIVLARDGRPQPPVPRETGAVSKCAAAAGRRGNDAVAAATPAQRALPFPRLRPESAFWRPAPPREPPKEPAAVLPLDIRTSPPYGQLDAAALPGSAQEREAIQRSLGDEALTTGLARIEGRSIAMALHLGAGQSTALRLCAFDPSTRKLSACGSVPLPGTVSPVFSADHRRLLLTSNDAQDGRFRLLDVARLGEACRIEQPPAGRVDTAAFSPAGDRLAVVTMEHELWSYELTPACEARLVLRTALPALREGTRSALAWLDATGVVWVAGQGEVFAVDAASGVMRWARHTLWPLAGRGVQVRTSGDGKLVALFDQRHLQLASSANGLALAGLLDARTLKGGGDICEAEVAASGEIRLRLQAGNCATPPGGESAADWRRLAPDDPALGFEGRPGLWRRTGVSERDGRTPVTLQDLLK